MRSYLRCLPQARTRSSSAHATAQESLLVPTVVVRLLGLCKVKVDWNWGLGDMSRGMVECCTGPRVRIFGINAKNRACWEGGTDEAVDEGGGLEVRYGDDKRDHRVKFRNPE